MTTWIALLRGINVGGKNRLPMKDLTALLENIGCSSVATYIQSGNVVFEMTGHKASQLSKLIGEAINKSHGFKPKVHLLSVKELATAVASNPFREAEADPGTLHLFFLSGKPASAKLSEISDAKAESERFALIGRIFYLSAPDGIGRSRLAASAERLLGVDATGRNWRTVTKLLALAKQR